MIILGAFFLLALAVIGPLIIAIIFILRTPTPPPDGHRLSNEARRPLAELIDTVVTRDNVRFTFKGSSTSARDAEQKIRELILCFDGKIRGQNWGSVFCQLARHFDACLDCSADVNGTAITLILKDGSRSSFQLADGCHVCSP